MVLTGVIALVLPRIFLFIQKRLYRTYNVILSMLLVIFLLLQFLIGAIQLLWWGLREEVFFIQWPFIVFPIYLIIFLLSIWIQKLQKIEEISIQLALYSSLALTWVVSINILEMFFKIIRQ